MMKILIEFMFGLSKKFISQKAELTLVGTLLLISAFGVLSSFVTGALQNPLTTRGSAAGSCAFETIVKLENQDNVPLDSSYSLRFSTNIDPGSGKKLETTTRTINATQEQTGRHLITSLESSLQNKPLKISLLNLPNELKILAFRCQNKSGANCLDSKNDIDPKLDKESVIGLRTICNQKLTITFQLEESQSKTIRPTVVNRAPISPKSANKDQTTPLPENETLPSPTNSFTAPALCNQSCTSSPNSCGTGFTCVEVPCPPEQICTQAVGVCRKSECINNDKCNCAGATITTPTRAPSPTPDPNDCEINLNLQLYRRSNDKQEYQLDGLALTDVKSLELNRSIGKFHPNNNGTLNLKFNSSKKINSFGFDPLKAEYALQHLALEPDNPNFIFDKRECVGDFRQPISGTVLCQTTSEGSPDELRSAQVPLACGKNLTVKWYATFPSSTSVDSCKLNPVNITYKLESIVNGKTQPIHPNSPLSNYELKSTHLDKNTTATAKFGEGAIINIKTPPTDNAGDYRVELHKYDNLRYDLVENSCSGGTSRTQSSICPDFKPNPDKKVISPITYRCGHDGTAKWILKPKNSCEFNLQAKIIIKDNPNYKFTDYKDFSITSQLDNTTLLENFLDTFNENGFSNKISQIYPWNNLIDNWYFKLNFPYSKYELNSVNCTGPSCKSSQKPLEALVNYDCNSGENLITYTLQQKTGKLPINLKVAINGLRDFKISEFEKVEKKELEAKFTIREKGSGSIISKNFQFDENGTNTVIDLPIGNYDVVGDNGIEFINSPNKDKKGIFNTPEDDALRIDPDLLNVTNQPIKSFEIKANQTANTITAILNIRDRRIIFTKNEDVCRDTCRGNSAGEFKNNAPVDNVGSKSPIICIANSKANVEFFHKNCTGVGGALVSKSCYCTNNDPKSEVSCKSPNVVKSQPGANYCKEPQDVLCCPVGTEPGAEMKKPNPNKCCNKSPQQGELSCESRYGAKWTCEGGKSEACSTSNTCVEKTAVPSPSDIPVRRSTPPPSVRIIKADEEMPPIIKNEKISQKLLSIENQENTVATCTKELGVCRTSCKSIENAKEIQGPGLCKDNKSCCTASDKTPLFESNELYASNACTGTSSAPLGSRCPPGTNEVYKYTDIKAGSDLSLLKFYACKENKECMEELKIVTIGPAKQCYENGATIWGSCGGNKLDGTSCPSSNRVIYDCVGQKLFLDKSTFNPNGCNYEAVCDVLNNNQRALEAKAKCDEDPSVAFCNEEDLVYGPIRYSTDEALDILDTYLFRKGCFSCMLQILAINVEGPALVYINGLKTYYNAYKFLIDAVDVYNTATSNEKARKVAQIIIDKNQKRVVGHILAQGSLDSNNFGKIKESLGSIKDSLKSLKSNRPSNQSMGVVINTFLSWSNCVQCISSMFGEKHEINISGEITETVINGLIEGLTDTLTFLEEIYQIANDSQVAQIYNSLEIPFETLSVCIDEECQTTSQNENIKNYSFVDTDLNSSKKEYELKCKLENQNIITNCQTAKIKNKASLLNVEIQKRNENILFAIDDEKQNFDLNNDGSVNTLDYSIFLTNYGSNYLDLDYNQDAVVNSLDASKFINKLNN